MPRPTDEINFLRHATEPIRDDSENQIVYSIRRLLEYVDEMERTLPPWEDVPVPEDAL